MTRNEQRILAIDVRRSRFGYVLFDGPTMLLDWGASAIPRRLHGRATARMAQKRVATVLRNCGSTAVVLRRPRRIRTGINSTPGPILKALFHETTSRSIPVQFVTREAIQDAFHGTGANTKEEIAEALTQIFPELLTRLPPKRKTWETEPQAMVVFDAVATGFVHWQQSGTADQASEKK